MTNFFTDTGLALGSQHTYDVLAVDGVGNKSAKVRVVGSSLDTVAPTIPTNVAATAISQSQINLTWTASTDVGLGVAGYRVYRDGAVAGTTSGTSYSDTGLAVLSAHAYQVTAFDSSANESAKSLVANATTLDQTAPTVPTGLTSTLVSSTEIDLSWNAATDVGSGLAGYRLYRGGVQIAQQVGRTFADTGRTAATQYSYQITAYDNSGNESAKSPAFVVTTSGASQGVVFDRFVSTTGNDANNGLTPATAWAITSLSIFSHTANNVANCRATAGKKIGLMPGTYPMASLMFSDPVSGALQFIGGTSGSPTYVASCDASGNYSPRTATLQANDNGVFGGIRSTGPGVGDGPIISHTGSFPSSYALGNLTIDGLILTGFSFKGIRIGGLSSGDGPAITGPVIVKNCELTGGGFNAGDSTDNCNAIWVDGIQNASGTGCLVSNNFIHDNIGHAGATSADHLNGIIVWGQGTAHCFGVVIEYNTCINTGSIYGKEGNVEGNTVRYNYVDMSTYTANGSVGVQDFMSGGQNASYGLTKASAFYNNIILLWGNTPGGSVGFGWPTLSNNYAWQTGIDVHNNTVIVVGGSAGPTAAWLDVASGANGVGGVKFYNNIYAPGGVSGSWNGNGNFLTNSGGPAVWDYNLYPASGASWRLVQNASNNTAGLSITVATYTTVAAWTAGLAAQGGIASADSHSVTGAPTFTNAGTSAQKYQLTSGSVGHNTGSTNGTTGGTACDMGAWGGTDVNTGQAIAQIGCNFQFGIPVVGFIAAGSQYALYSSDGNAADMQELTLVDTSGAQGNKVPALPQWWFSFKDGTLTPDALSQSTHAYNFDPDLSNTWVSGAASGIRGAPGACRHDCTKSTSTGPQTDMLGNALIDPVAGASTQIYFCADHLWNMQPGATTGWIANVKILRLWSGWPIGSFGGANNNNGWIGENTGHGENLSGGISWNTGQSQNYGGAPPDANRHYVLEDQFQNPSGNNVADCIREYIVNGAFKANQAQRFTPVTGSGLGVGMMTVHTQCQISNNAEPAGETLTLANIYKDTTWQRVMQSPEPSWQTPPAGFHLPPPATRTIQLCTSWLTSGGQSIIKFLNRWGVNVTQAGQNIYAIDATGTATRFGNFARFKYFVSPTGSSGNNGLTPATAWDINSLNTKGATYAGSAVGIVQGTYNVQALAAQRATSPTNDYTVYVLDIAGGPDATHSTYIGACNSNGLYVAPNPAAADGAKCAVIITQKVGSTYGNQIAGFSLKNVTMGQSQFQTRPGNLIIDGIGLTGNTRASLGTGADTGAGTFNDVIFRNCEVWDTNATGVAHGGNINAVSFNAGARQKLQNCYIHDGVADSGIADSADHLSGVITWSGFNDGVIEYVTVTRHGGGFYGKESTQSGTTIRYCVADVSAFNFGDTAFSPISDFVDGDGVKVFSAYNNLLLGMGVAMAPNLTGPGANPIDYHNNTSIITPVVGHPSAYNGPTTACNVAGGLKFYNNVVYNASGASVQNGLQLLKAASPGLVDYNLYCRGAMASDKFATYNGPGGASGTQYTGLAAWQTFLGGTFESHSIGNTVAPTFLGGTGLFATRYKLNGGAGVNAGRDHGTTLYQVDMGCWGGNDLNTGAPVTQIGCSFAP